MTKIKLTTKSKNDLPDKYCRIILTEDKTSWHRLVETKTGQLEYRMGVGKSKKINTRKFRTLVRSIVLAAKSHKLVNIVIELDIEKYPLLAKSSQWFYQTLAENLALASYDFTKYKTDKDKEDLTEILVSGLSKPSDKKSFAIGLITGEATNFTRDLANTSAEEMNPTALAKVAKSAVSDTKAVVRVLNHKRIKELKMGLLDAVGKGASDAPRLILIEYWGASKKSAPIALIGKGITYDSGGLNVKPTGGMHDMHMDMSGGAAVIGTMRAIAKLGLKKNVIALIPAAENSISAKSMRAGDIATAMNGKTVEILHTDAEGRMVLADAMTYAEKFYKPKTIIDVATLTGAALVALGQQTSAVLTKNKDLQTKLVDIGEETGDLMWPLPLWDEYKASLKSNRADLSNIAVNFARWGGCIEGGTFLSFFAPSKTPWAHIDMAPRMESIPSDKLAKGATGEPVKALVRFVEKN
jgi:leucyl aminopeptidase